MKIFLLDDEANARETVKAYLQRVPGLNPEIREADSIANAKEVLANYQPDLALLDINLQDGTSFDLLSILDPDSISFKIIFISAHDDFAIKAFKFSAVDYILKPVNPIEFQTAINKALVESLPTLPDQINHLRQDIQTRKTDKVVLKDNQAIHIVPIDSILYCESMSNYTAFNLEDSSKITISKTLGEFEDLLRGNRFFRSHRSYLINLDKIKKYDKREGGTIQMSNNDSVPLARNKKEIFIKFLDQL